MFITKRPFKNFGKVYTAGTVIDDSAVIKRFKGKVAESKIIEVTEQSYNGVAAYFKAKFGVDIAPLEAEPTEVPKEHVKPVVTTPVTEVKKVVVAKPN